MGDPNVLPIFPVPDGNLFREAVAKSLRTIKREHGLSNGALADRLGCDVDTVKNALAEDREMRGSTVARIAYVFGEDAIRPIRELWLGRFAEPAPSPVARIAAAQEEIRKALAELERDAA